MELFSSRACLNPSNSFDTLLSSSLFESFATGRRLCRCHLIWHFTHTHCVDWPLCKKSQRALYSRWRKAIFNRNPPLFSGLPLNQVGQGKGAVHVTAPDIAKINCFEVTYQRALGFMRSFLELRGKQQKQ